MEADDDLSRLGRVGARMTWGSASHHRRYVVLGRKTRRRCRLGPEGWACTNLETHRGMANGVCLLAGCEFHVYEWANEQRRS